MALEIGTRLGPYEIVEAVGAGGMGEVYRAHDTRLDRTVAIKVLAEHMAADPDLRQRLEREAKAVSSLSHPHVCALYDVGHEDGVDYLVMEFLEGESMAERLVKGPLPVDELLRIAIQIADALEKAHRSGIIHRDLKPANIMLTREGAKLLDFGLAKARAPISESGADLTASPTESQPLTAAGTVLGTYQYMAPEQLECKEIDARTDIFALGAVLYEMATGQRAFGGDSAASLIAGIMHEQPQPASQVRPMTPPALDRVIQTCLAKDPDDRWQTAHDVKLQLQWIAEGGSVAGVPAPVAARRKSRERLAWAIAAAAALAAILATVGYLRRAPAPLHVTRFQIAAPRDLDVVGSPRISPDGRTLAFQATDATGESRLWVRPLDSLEARPLLGTEGMVYRPIWSSDSRHVAFFADGRLKRVAVEGGQVQIICDEDQGADGSWNQHGDILYDSADNDPIRRVGAGGGIPRPAVPVNTEAGETAVGWPEFLPDGRRFLYVLWTENANSQLMLGELDSGQATHLMDVDSRVQYAEPGYLVYVRDDTLVVQPFDAESGEIRGDPRPLAQQMSIDAVGLADFSAARNGTLVFRTAGSAVRRLVWRDRSGRELGSVGTPGVYGDMWLSPDGGRVVVTSGDSDGEEDIWIHDLERGVGSRFTFDPASDIAPVWSPDGERIAFSSTRRTGSSYDLYVQDATGSGSAVELLTGDQQLIAGDWSRDGKYLICAVYDVGTSWDIWAVPMEGSGEPITVVATEFRESRPSFSPDGSWIAYQSDESGEWEIYVREFPGPGGRWQVSTAGGTDPHWSHDGSEIFYLDEDDHLASVVVQTTPAFRADLPEILFDPQLFPGTFRSRYAVAAGGERFLLLSRAETQTNPPLTVVMNWTAALFE
jgi:tRNA A-37 threonylcarbamoyl transferase component Bud32/dipeptidyl aminopeptidase/acylaminoacyl peptidase